MLPQIDRMLDAYDGGRLSRRTLMLQLTGLLGAAAGVRAAQDTPKPASTFTATQINHVALGVTDVSRSRRCYEQHPGRTLRSDEEDEKEERRSETGDQTNLRLPPELLRSTGPEARYPYPKWEQLRRVSPEERRLILDYFRMLNAERGSR